MTRQGAAPEVKGLSAALVEDLTAHRTAALRIELARNPAVALAITVHALASSLLYRGQDSFLTLHASSEPLERRVKMLEDSPAHQALLDEAARWGDHLPGEGIGLMGWCLAQPQEVLLNLLAFLSALTVDAVLVKHGPAGTRRHADRLAEALSLDMRNWWTPTVDGFFGRLPKAALIEAMAEAKVTADAPFDGVKKADAAKMAAKALKDSGWLPEPLRSRREGERRGRATGSGVSFLGASGDGQDRPALRTGWVGLTRSATLRRERRCHDDAKLRIGPDESEHGRRNDVPQGPKLARQRKRQQRPWRS